MNACRVCGSVAKFWRAAPWNDLILKLAVQTLTAPAPIFSNTPLVTFT